ncbi:MAG: rhs-family protein [Osedax symbiont Rs1]|nr:MAG: rhs-family protein [Osedax symbiont Rs1]
MKETINSNTTTHTIMGGDKVIIIGGNSRITLAKGSITLEAASINLKGNVSIGGSGSASVPTLADSANSGSLFAEECPYQKKD